MLCDRRQNIRRDCDSVTVRFSRVEMDFIDGIFDLGQPLSSQMPHRDVPNDPNIVSSII